MYWEPYLKFSHFNSGLFWLVTRDYFHDTHNYNFFQQFSKRWKKENWGIFKSELNKIIPNWYAVDRCEWINKIENSNRTYFDLSVGIYISVYIPYSFAQEKDNSYTDSDFAKEIKDVILKLKEIID